MVCRRHKSLQVCKSASLQVCKSASLQVCKSASLQVCKSASLQSASLQSASLQVCSLQVCKSAVCKCRTPLFERLSKINKNGAFLFGISYFVLEIFLFLYYANKESGDVINGSTLTIEYWIKNIGAKFLKLGTRTIHHKRNRMAPTVLMLWQHCWLQSLSVKNQISPFSIF